ncbi:hypothetical protein C0J52_15066 [Blattella germanica]|nr:hypothetical protein C0J52_15066 [Blattella germanica]
MFLEPDESHHASLHASIGTYHAQEEEEEEGDVASMEQHFFPSFAPVFPSNPLGHSRPSVFQEPAHSQRPALLRPQHNSFQPVNFGGGSFRENPYIHTAESNANGILGSGNFRVIHGGTFYSDEDQKDLDYDGRGNYYSPYYYNNNNNGHGRPAFYSGGGANPRPQNVRGNDFFANFRDFADINTPTKSSFSEYIVVYVNKNSSKHDNETEGKASNSVKSKPKNIIESLTMLDQQDYALKNNPSKSSTATDDDLSFKVKSEKKWSTSSPAKLKLALYEDKFSKQKNKKLKGLSPTIPSKDLYEPLLALS